MPKIDEVKEYIGILKAIFITFIILDTSMASWVFKNFEQLAWMKIYSVIALIVLLSLVIYRLFIKILEEIKSLKDL